jgi:predicted O-methyltransferase YrrM
VSTFDEAMVVTSQLQASGDALGALYAALRVEDEGLKVDPEVGARLDAIRAELGIGALSDEDRRRVLGAIRAFTAQSAALMAEPDRAPGWGETDPATLQSFGRMSMAVAELIGTFADLPPAPRILDIGTGVGLLAVAFCQHFAGATVVGVDVWTPSLALARQNVESAGLADRIELREQDVTTLNDEAAFDLVWVPAPFLPRAIVAETLTHSRRALKPGGWLVFGAFAGPPDRVATLVNELRIVRAGGHPWTDAEAVAALRDAGFDDAAPVERTWSAPAAFVSARAAGGR